MRVAITGKFLTGALVAVLAVAMVGTDAMAWSYGSWGSAGSSGSSGSWGSSASYGSSGSSGSYGSHGGGLFARIRARRAARRASYGSHGSSASYGSSGSYGSTGSTGSWGSAGSAGSAGSYGVSYSATHQATPTHQHYASTTPSSSSTGSATVNVSVPEGAEVIVNDSKTTSTGSERSYVSRGLKSGMSYTYNFVVKYEDANQETVTENKTVRLSVGDVVELDFSGASEPAIASEETEPVETKLTLDVPEDARVFLLGSETQQTGETRTFTTNHLKAGQQWEGYEIRVELDRDGRTLVRQQELKIKGGESYELAFSFDQAATTQLAQLSK